MYICVCNQITDSDIKQAICKGQAQNLADVRKKLGVATDCGACQLEATRVIEETLANNKHASPKPQHSPGNNL